MADSTPTTGKAVTTTGAAAPSGSAKSSLSGMASSLRGRSDLLLAMGIVGIIVVLILPMPGWSLDIFLALSMSFSVLILMTVIFLEKPLDFNSFPTVLLVSTLLRLSLNLASTRLILTNGHEGSDAAGKVIEAFGGFIMGNNYVIGIIVFIILVIVNFVVITKGAGRIAEVAARFVLDAMPGKQMAIDADLSSGLINEDEARAKRKELEEESSFYGAMDGAAKFVRGDAIAGILITMINVIGGMIIGVGQMDLSVTEAAETYTRLTVGDGLVSQIPALIVSVGAGMLVSKAGVTGTTDEALFGQLGQYPKAMGLSSGLMVALAVLPGTPFLPFMALAIATGSFAYFVPKERERAKKETEEKDKDKEGKAPVAEAPIGQTLAIDHIRLELGYGLLSLVNISTGNRLTEQIKGLRRQLAMEMGFVLPSVRIQDNLQLEPNSYRILIKEIEAGKGDARPSKLLVMDPKGGKIEIPGENTREPAFGLPAKWIETDKREEAHFKGYTVVDPQTVITTHITELVKDYMPELLSYTETQKLLDELPETFQKLIADVIPAQISLSGLQRVLQNLLQERVSIRDLPTILEGVAEATNYTKNTSIISEHVRSKLARQLCESNTGSSGMMPIVTLSPQWEQLFADSLIGSGEEKQLAMPPSDLQQFMQEIRTAFEGFAQKGEAPVLLTSPAIRTYVRSLIERFRPQTVVMSQNEIHPKARIKTMGQI